MNKAVWALGASVLAFLLFVLSVDIYRRVTVQPLTLVHYGSSR